MINLIRIIALTFLFVGNASAAKPLWYSNWDSGEPSNSWGAFVGREDCVEIKVSGKWNDRHCAIAAPSSNGLRYSCYDGVTWQLSAVGDKSDLNSGKADEFCKKLGDRFYFAAPFNSAQNEFLANTVEASGETSAWINVNDIDEEGEWQFNGAFRSATKVPYITYWATNEPSQSVGSNKDCTVMDKTGFIYASECDAGPYRYVCAKPQQTWHVTSTIQGDNKELYTGERACREQDILYGFKSSEDANDHQGLLNSVQSQIGASELVWININDRLKEGDHQLNENRFFWNDNEPNGNVSGTEECVVKNNNNLEHGWNDIACNGSTSRPYACYQHATDTWVRSTAQSTDFNLEQGIAACQAMDSGSHTYTFWAPTKPSENESAASINNSWLNIKYDQLSSRWLVNQESAYWGGTTIWDKNDKFENVNFRTVSEPNNGIFPAHAERSPYQKENPGGENCVSQQPGGDWYDISCSNALKFACFDPSADLTAAGAQPWKLTAISQSNSSLYKGEEACKALDSSHQYHFLAPESPDQRALLADLAGQTAVWINATDRTEEKDWRYNQFLTFWKGEITDGSIPATVLTPQEPVSNQDKNCAIAVGSDSSLWRAAECVGSRPFLCFNGNDWALSALGTPGLDGVLSGQTACRALGANYNFAAPKTLSEQESAAALIVNNEVWVNAFDQEVEGEWKINQIRYWDINEPDSVNSNSKDCAFMQHSNGLWKTEACTGASRPYLCFDIKNEKWKLSVTNGNLDHFPLGQMACEAMNTRVEEYLYAAPVYQWEFDSALAIVNGQDAWINANDRLKEGQWVFNQSLYWSSTALLNNPEGKDCLTMNSNGYWNDTACSDGPHKVACYSGDEWYLAPVTTDLANFADGQRACDELGEGFRFFSPTTEEHNRDLRALISGSDLVWINGIDIAEEGEWVFNSTALQTPIWAVGEPNGGVEENCSYINDQGLWFDEACTNVSSISRQLVCQKTDGSLFISTTSVALNAEQSFDDAHQVCNSEDLGSVFYAPSSFNENEALRKQLLTNQEVWVNASDALIETRWVLNIAKTANLQVLGTAAVDGCVSIGANGDVQIESCASEYPVVCSNNYEWRVSRDNASLGETATDGKKISDAFAACYDQFQGEYTFATPENNDLRSKWQLSQAVAMRGRDKVWLNMADWFIESEFSSNMPYQNISLAATQTASGCAYVDGINDGWLIQEQCDTKGAHFACYDGITWKVALASGTVLAPGQASPSVDSWDQSIGEARCKSMFGQAFSFTAPISPSENDELNNKVALLGGANKDTWINYHANRFMSGNGQQWFADRINTTMLSSVSIDQGSTKDDCGALTHTTTGNGSELMLSDNACKTERKALCYNGQGWSVTSSLVPWNKAAAQCGNEFGQDHIFAVPRDTQERSAVLAKITTNESVWANYNDLSVESQWRANLPLRQWWADSEPLNLGNRDCAVLDGNTSGQWRSDYCDQALHNFACKDKTNASVKWQVTTEKGIWSEGFTACKKLGSEWVFDYPRDYFANLQVATTVSGSDNSDVQNTTADTVWINLTDQYREGDWQRGRQFFDWATNFGFDTANNCALVDTTLVELGTEAVKGSWHQDVCSESSRERQYACSNGKNWLIADAISPATGNNWDDGFAACAALDSANSWKFSAPNTSFDNERLKMAVDKASGTAWINLQDKITEGDWAANMPQ